MGIGALGIKNMVKNGGILTICITVPLAILEVFLADNATCYDLVGELASELIKVGISVVVGAIAGAFASAFAVYAFVPIGIAIVFTVGTGMLLNDLDNQRQMTEKLSKALEDMGNQIERSAKNKIYDAERGLYQGIRQFISSQGGYSGPF